ncbi:MAG: hypothetical protein NTX50_17470 [Candidatus Sumerlaeota bacterium]|nr:hypothetical protein [Candidatus Sumerlaeota bacterium]
MSDMELDDLTRIFEQSLSEAGFERPEYSGGLFEANIIRKDNREWLVVAAGINEAEAAELFPHHKNQAAKASAPLRLGRTCYFSLLFVVRPFELNSSQIIGDWLFPFAPGDGFPHVEMRKAYIKLVP